jgi:peptidoglycan L-alanyl-D-glutamate endopeptidase CwlK
MLHPAIALEVKGGIEEAEKLIAPNIAIRVVQGKRSKEEQEALFAQGRTKPGPIVTKARWWQTYHFYGLAFDFAFAIDKNGDGKYDEINWDTIKDFDHDGVPDWREVVRVFTAKGYRWGADWDKDGITKAEGDKDEHLVDAPHLEKTFGYNYNQLLEKYNAGQFISSTDKYVKL